jgi:hypothetical protein
VVHPAEPARCLFEPTEGPQQAGVIGRLMTSDPPYANKDAEPAFASPTRLLLVAHHSLDVAVVAGDAQIGVTSALDIKSRRLTNHASLTMLLGRRRKSPLY